MQKWEQCSLFDRGMYIYFVWPGGEKELARLDYSKNDYNLDDAFIDLEKAKVYLGQNGWEFVGSIIRPGDPEYIEYQYKRPLED